MSPRSSKSKTETTTAESLSPPRAAKLKSGQLELILVPVPSDADNRVMELLFAMAMEGNISAAKLFLDYFRSDPDDEPQLSPEDALKLLQDHLKDAA